MRLTSVLLADAAALCDGKLYLHGAGWDVINTPAIPMTFSGLNLALIMEMEPSELTEDAVFEVTLTDPDGQPVGIGARGNLARVESAQAVPHSPVSVPAVLNFPSVTFTRAGTYRFIVSVNDREFPALSFMVHAA